MPQILNLDRLAAAKSQDLLKIRDELVKDEKRIAAKDIEKLATDALGVLQEQGVYAFILFLLSKSGTKTAQNELDPESWVSCGILAHLLDLLRVEGLKSFCTAYPGHLDITPGSLATTVNTHKQEILNYVSGQIATDLNRLLIVKRLFEQTLIYIRYGAKAFSVSDAQTEAMP